LNASTNVILSIGGGSNPIATASSTGLSVTGTELALTYGGSGAAWKLIRTGASASTLSVTNSGGEIIHDYNSVGYSFKINGTEALQVRSGAVAVTGTIGATDTISTTRASDNTIRVSSSVAGGNVYFNGVSGASGDMYVTNTTNRDLYLGTNNASATTVKINTTGLDVTGESRCDSFRIDAAPSASAATTTHKLAINCNGTTYYILLSNV